MTRKQVFVTEVSEGAISSKPQNLPGGKKNHRKLIEFSWDRKCPRSWNQGHTRSGIFLFAFSECATNLVNNSGFTQIWLLVHPSSYLSLGLYLSPFINESIHSYRRTYRLSTKYSLLKREKIMNSLIILGLIYSVLSILITCLFN